MRNLSKIIVSEKASLMFKGISMKKFIMITMIVVITFFSTTVHADEVDVALYIHDAVPGSSIEDARECSRVWKNGGMYRNKIKNIHLECRRRFISLKWGYSKE